MSSGHGNLLTFGLLCCPVQFVLNAMFIFVYSYFFKLYFAQVDSHRSNERGLRVCCGQAAGDLSQGDGELVTRLANSRN